MDRVFIIIALVAFSVAIVSAVIALAIRIV